MACDRGVARRVASARKAGSSAAPASTLDAAHRAAYNLDYAEALALARRAVKEAPTGVDRPPRAGVDPLAEHPVSSRRGHDRSLPRRQHHEVERRRCPSRPADLDAEFKQALARAIELAEARLKSQPHDLQAKFDAGAAYALQASYTASVEGSMTSAFGAARRAYDAQEEVLDRDPKRVDAGLVVGTYRYVVSVMALPTRVIAYVAGFGGGKEKGIALLEAAATREDTRVEAKMALMLIYSREGRHAEVERIAHELGAELPAEPAVHARRRRRGDPGRAGGDAEAVLTRGLAVLDQDTRPRLPGERALWLYKRGLARVNLNHPKEAHVDLQEALRSDPLAWVRGRIHVELGKLADLEGRRADAVAAYETAKTACERGSDPACVTEANRLLRQPFRLPGAKK